MSDPRNDLPATNAPNFTQRVRESLQTYLGRQGNPLDRGLTLRDLIDAGMVKMREGFTLRPGSGTLPLLPGDAVQSSEVDLTQPPQPTGLALSAAISHVFIEHDEPAYTQGHGHLRTRVYGVVYTSGPLPVFADAVELTQFSGTVFAMPSEPSTTWRLWIKWESVDGVLSATPAGGTNGMAVTTAQNVAKLLTALSGQVTESQLYTDLNTRINLIDAGTGVVGSVNQRVLAEATARAQAIIDEATARATAIAAEATARGAAIAAETAARTDAIIVETNARNAQLQIESHQRIEGEQATAEAALQAVIAANNERVDRTVDVATARQELTTEFQAGILAEATARLALTAVVNTNSAEIISEQTARATADAALTTSVNTLVANVAANTAAISTEQTARATADSAESSQRSLLAAQLRGSYEGNDLAAISTGLIYQERIARATQDESLAQQITLLSAGAGEQFDWQTIWYFDTGVESWSGNGTPTASVGWLRPSNQASGAYVNSNTGIGAEGAKYSQVRLRIRKTGSPTFAGYLWWRASGDSTWDTGRRVALTEPTFDANNIGLITVNPGWNVTIDRIRVDLSDAQTGTDYFEIDWVAIGRPSPGASSAQLLAEQTARAAADSAEVISREALSTKLTGQADPTGLTLSSLTTGLLFDERAARVSAVDSVVSTVTTLQATVATNAATASAAVTTEATARATADSAEVTARQALSTKLTGLADPSGATVETLASGLIYDEKTQRVTADNSLSTSISTLNSTVGTISGTLTTLQQTVADNNTATVQSVTTLVAQDRATQAALDQSAETDLRNLLAGENERKTREATTAVIQQDLSVKIVEGLSAEAAARLLLSARVNDNAAAISTEQTARATGDSSLASSISVLAATVDTNLGTTMAAITAEQTARASADAAEATQRQAVAAVANAKNKTYYQNDAPSSGHQSGDLWFDTNDGNKAYRFNGALWVETTDTRIEANAAAIVTEQTARANADAAEAAARIALAAQLTNEIGVNTAAVTAEQNARVTADNALATDISSITAIANAKNRTYYQTEAPTIGQQAGDLWFDSNDGNKAYRYSGTAWVETSDTRIAANAAAIVAEANARADADTAEANQRIALATTVNNNQTALEANYYTKSGTDSAIAGSLTTYGATVDGKISTALVDYYTKAGTDSAISSATTSLASTVAANQAAALTNYYTKAAADSAIAGQVSVVSARLDSGDFAAVKTESSVNASKVDGLRAQYTVKIDNAGAVSGFGLSSSLVDGGTPTSKFIVNVDQFAVTTPLSSMPLWAANTEYTVGQIVRVSGTTDRVMVCKVAGRSGFGTPPLSGVAVGGMMPDNTVTWQVASSAPFIVQTVPTTVNGLTIPAGVYIDAAYILNATVQNAQIANQAVDDAKIANLSASKITAGYISADRIQTGSLDAKIANLDTAVITSGFINAARINTASIANADISAARITTGYIDTARIADASIANAKITSLDAAKITSGYIDAARINASTITADMIVSRSATRFELADLSIGNGTWHTYSFDMDRMGIVCVIGAVAWNYSALTGSSDWTVEIVDSVFGGTFTRTWTTSFSYGSPTAPTLMNSVGLFQGTHTLRVKSYITGATANHIANVLILRSYR